MKRLLFFALMAFAFVGCGDDDGNDDVVNKVDLAHFKQILVGTWQTSEEHYGVWGKTIKFSSDGMMNDSVPYSLSVRKSVGEMMGGHGNYYEYEYCSLYIDGEGSYSVHEEDADHFTFERVDGHPFQYNYERVK